MNSNNKKKTPLNFFSKQSKEKTIDNSADVTQHDILIVTSAPHIVRTLDTRHIMGHVLIALIPAMIFGIFVFGYRAATLTLVCIISCVVFEYAFCRIAKWKNSIGDLSAVLTGVLLAFNLPSSFPYWMAIIGSFVAIVIVKQLFGGLGQNFVNPAVAGRLVLFISFTSHMTTWPLPNSGQLGFDAVTGPTPLAIFAEGGELPPTMDVFLGFVGGCIGEVSALAILLGGLYLIFKKIISPIIPFVFIGTVAVISVMAGVDPLFQIFTGGIMLGAFFCATDYVTSPMMPLGRVIFAIGCGIITMVIRLFGSYPEGVSFAIIIMNILSPRIDKMCINHKIKKGGVQNVKK